MSRKPFLILALCLGAASRAFAADAPAAEPAWDVQYTATVMPQQSNWGWGSFEGPNTSATLADGALRIVDEGTAKGEMRNFSRNWEINPQLGGSVEARVKAVSCSGLAGMGILIADGLHEEFINLYPDRIELGHRGLAYKMNTTDAFHTYRFAIRDADIRVFVDGKLALDGAGRFTEPAYNGRRLVLFGSISSAATGEAYWQAVRFGIVRPKVARIPGAEDVIVYKRPDIYACFPGLVPLANGDLYTSFGARTHHSHIDGSGGTAARISHDGGRTWEEVTGPVTDPLSQAADGALVSAGAYGWKHVSTEERAALEARGIEIHSVPTKPNTIAYTVGAFFQRSTDAGKTWQRTEIQTPPMAMLMCYNRSAAVRTADGVRLTAVYGKRKLGEPGEAFVLRSADDGKNWECLPLAKDPGGKLFFNETALGINAAGELIAMIRTEPPAGGNLYQSVSRDGGKSWSTPVDTGIWGYPANLLLLRDGRMLCTYGYRRDAMGIRAVLSNDGGKSWDAAHPLILRSDGVGNGGDLGYPLTTQLADGSLFTIYYMTNGDGVTHIAGTRWPLPARK